MPAASWRLAQVFRRRFQVDFLGRFGSKLRFPVEFPKIFRACGAKNPGSLRSPDPSWTLISLSGPRLVPTPGPDRGTSDDTSDEDSASRTCLSHERARARARRARPSLAGLRRRTDGPRARPGSAHTRRATRLIDPITLAIYVLTFTPYSLLLLTPVLTLASSSSRPAVPGHHEIDGPQASISVRARVHISA